VAVFLQQLGLDDHLPLVGELDGVADQIVEDLAQPRRIPPQIVGHFRRHEHRQLQALGVGSGGKQIRHLF
jgi:hypothetical protein